MTYEFALLEAASIDGIRSVSYEAGPGRWTCVSYLVNTPVRSFVTTQHPVRKAAIAHMAVLLAAYFNAEVVRWNQTRHPDVLRRRLDEDARGAASARDFGNSIIANLLRHDTVVAVPFAGY